MHSQSHLNQAVLDFRGLVPVYHRIVIDLRGPMSLKLTTAVILAALTFALPAVAEDLTITIVNSSSKALAQFFTSPTDVDNWEEDVFGDGVLPSGNKVDLTIADGRSQCDYDLKFVMEDGQEITGTQNMCETSTFTLSDD